MGSKKLVVVVGACAALLVLAIGGAAGLLPVSAAGRLSNAITVTLTEPVNLDTINVYSEGGQVPPFFPLEVGAIIQTFIVRGVTPDVAGVDFTLNGDDPVDGTVAGADQVVQGVRLSDSIGNLSQWTGAIDLSLGTFDPPPGRAPLFPVTFVSSATIRALGTIDTSYVVRGARATSTGFDDFDEATITVNVFDAADIDPNGNDKPDAQGLADIFSGSQFGQGPSGGQVVTEWVTLPGGPLLRGVIGPTLGLTLNSAGGVVFLDVFAPSLATLQAADAALSIYDTGRLSVSVASQPTDLVDGPPGVDPLLEFNLTDPGTGATLPAPQNLFALVNILLRDSAVNPPEWLALELLPGSLTIQMDLSGPGVAAGLVAGTEVRGYIYDTTNSQDVAGNLTDDGDQNGWLEELNTTLSDQNPLIRDTAATGDDTITVTLTSASVIAGSNAAPPSNLVPAGGGGGGSDGLCFIATAAYGTPLAEDINILRRVRDSYLLNTAFGSAFVDTYYRLSPPIAERVADHGVFRVAVRAVLTPVIVLSRLALAAPGLCMALMAMMAAGILARRVRRRRRNPVSYLG